MPDPVLGSQTELSPSHLISEVERLQKIVKVLMDRAERSTSTQGSEFSQFQTTIMLEEQVRRRTQELETALQENERIARALRESEARFRGLVGLSLVGISIVQDGAFAYVNPRLAEMFGYSVREMVGMQRLDITVESDRPLVLEQMRLRLSGKLERVNYLFRGVRKDGTVIDLEVHGTIMDVAGKPALINTVLDITERVRAERELRLLQDQLRDRAIHDPLTGLYNRWPLNEFLDRELCISERTGAPVSVVMTDLDHFKKINDNYGHPAGDEVLRAFSKLVQRYYRASDILCRFGGEEFLILLPNVIHRLARQRTEQLRTVLADTPLVCGSTTIRVTASFGVATFPDHGRSRDSLIAAADQALYAAKRAGRNRVESPTELQTRDVTAKPLHSKGW